MNVFNYNNQPIYRLRFSKSGNIVIVWDIANDEPVRSPSQDDMDRITVGKDLSAADIERLDD